MVAAAELGGAQGLRLNHPEIVSRAKAQTDLPVIGIWKQILPESEVYITPTLASATALISAGADVLALDATARQRPAESLAEMVSALKGQVCLMADISTLAEGLAAQALGFDCLGTTLAGYTAYSRQQPEPDFELLQALVAQSSLPVIMEGRIDSPEAAAQALEMGAHAVVVGSAITRPQWITRRYVAAMQADQRRSSSR